MNTDDRSIIVNTKLAYSIEEAAAATGYSVDTIRIAIRSHRLVARYANSKPVIRTSELDDWLESLPSEPKGGHRPVSQLANDMPSPNVSTDVPASSSAETAKPLFRTPEEVAPELGISKSALRQYCKISGIHTRLSKNRIVLHADDIPRLVEWIKGHRKAEQERWGSEVDHFSAGSKTTRPGAGLEVDHFG